MQRYTRETASCEPATAQHDSVRAGILSSPMQQISQRFFSAQMSFHLLLELASSNARGRVRRQCNAGINCTFFCPPPQPPLSPWPTPHPTQISSTRLPLTQPFLNQKTHSPLQTKLNAYLLHASQVHSEPSTREFLTFIGNHTPHSSALEFAEGFQLYKS
jgi:hypothetical protein